MPIVPQTGVTVVAEFPKHYFLENLAVRFRRLDPGHGLE